jgi:hypothetical protein
LVNDQGIISPSRLLFNSRKNHFAKKRLTELNKKDNKFSALLFWITKTAAGLMDLGIIDETNLNLKISSLKAELNNIKNRKEAVSNPFLIKIFKIIKLYKNGEYNSFGGLKAAVRDLISP